MRKTIKPLALAITLALSANVYAEEIGVDDVATSEAVVIEELSIEQDVTAEDEIDEFMSKVGYRLVETGRAQVVYGTATSNSKNLSTSSILKAYDRAVLSALEMAAKESGVKATSESMSVFLDDNPSFDANVCSDDGNLDQKTFLKKVAEVGELVVKNQMKEMGIDESEIEAALAETPKKESKAMLQDFYSKTASVKTKWEATRGFVTAKTVISVDEDNYPTVGVVLIKFSALESLLNEMIANPSSFDPTNWDFDSLKIRSINERFIDENDEYIQFNSIHDYAKYSMGLDMVPMGTEMVLDTKGYPTFISYSYKGKNKSSKTDKNADRAWLKSAKLRAQADSLVQMVNFMDMRTQSTTEMVDLENYQKNAVAEYLGCEIVEGSKTDESGYVEMSQSIKATVKTKSSNKKELKGSKNGYGKYYNPYKEKELAYYSYTYWSPFEHANQVKRENPVQLKKVEKAKKEDTGKNVENKKHKTRSSNSVFDMDF